MACRESSRRIDVRLDREDRLVTFTYTKIACGREIGTEGRLRSFCRGMRRDAILRFSFEDLPAELAGPEEEGRFLLFLEWAALRAALLLYGGAEPEGGGDRHRIASIERDDAGVSIRLVVSPPEGSRPVPPWAPREGE